MIQPEYSYSVAELPKNDELVVPSSSDEGVVASESMNAIGDLAGKSIVVDITGFMRHTLLVLIARLFRARVERFWLIYSDPGRYALNEATLFSKGGVQDVRPIPGYYGSRDPGDFATDTLVLGTGYDVEMMRAVVEKKRRARRIDVLGLPSLQPSMFQENVLSVALLDDDRTLSQARTLYAPANDPFSTAQVLHDEFHDALRKGRISGLYLAPTGTKVQAVGFALYYLSECTELPAALLLPIPARYDRETTRGHSRSWLYEVDLRLMGALN